MYTMSAWKTKNSKTKLVNYSPEAIPAADPAATRESFL